MMDSQTFLAATERKLGGCGITEGQEGDPGSKHFLRELLLFCCLPSSREQHRSNVHAHSHAHLGKSLLDMFDTDQDTANKEITHKLTKART